jgi:phosphonate transport system permease protein
MLAGLLSLFLPGLGQVFSREYLRGIAIFFTVGTALAIAAWFKEPAWFIIPGILWIWNVWDAIRQPAGAPVAIAAVLWLALAYGIGWQVTEINLGALFRNGQRASSILRPMLQPDFIARRQNRTRYYVTVQVPCSPNPPRATNTTGEVTITASPDCVTVGENILVAAQGLQPNFPTEVAWVTPTGGVIMLGEKQAEMMVVNSDENGNLTVMFPVPTGIGASEDFVQDYRISLTQIETLSGYSLSPNGRYILQGIYETLALALLATALGAILALPLSFLAARNLMGGNPFTYSVYMAVRSLLNIFRSIEALILAIIFVIIVGLGPFPGMLALTIHTTAALGKLYSEVIEGIEPGPIEAVRATGATWLQVVRYAVIPQIVPPFTALTIYRWDINVRSSTIIGFVGGGGIGFFLWQWILLGDYRAVSASFITIAIVVIIMDFFSAQLRARLN